MPLKNFVVRIFTCVLALFTILAFGSFAAPTDTDTNEVQDAESSESIDVIIPEVSLENMPNTESRGNNRFYSVSDMSMVPFSRNWILLRTSCLSALTPLAVGPVDSTWFGYNKIDLSFATSSISQVHEYDEPVVREQDFEVISVLPSEVKTSDVEEDYFIEIEDIVVFNDASDGPGTALDAETEELAVEDTSEFEYTQEEIDILATVIYNEAWGGCTTRHRELVAAVVMNRVHSDLFPNTIYEVVCQPNQYSTAYADPWSYEGQNARSNAENWATCQEIAMKAMRGEVECPENVLFQANFVQGHGIYETCYTSYSVSYFCYY